MQKTIVKWSTFLKIKNEDKKRIYNYFIVMGVLSKADVDCFIFKIEYCVWK